MTSSITLYEPVQANKAFDAAYQGIKGALLQGKRFVLQVKEEKRSNAQNAKFHAICSDISKSGALWAGKERTLEQWKVLLVSGHATATKEGSEVVAGLEGEFINLRESTALMSKKRGSSLIEYTLAWCAMKGIRLPAYESAYE